ncbi:MAG: SEC-C domain-containing protein [Eggerthellaceae bacterium]|nr:SEC-C domain-containing protein [Eggerthellaceae bacterium]
MVLNDEQNDIFFDTMDALLYYVNDRFRVVEDFELSGMSPLDDVKSSLVARALWDNVAIIDDFVRDFSYRLPNRCLDLAESWKNALPGFYTLVRYQSGRALLMSEAGVFSVCGVTYELEQEIGPAPAYVEMVLLPFEDLIIYDGFLQAYDTDRSASELQRIQDEFENRCAKGIALTGDDFARQAGVYLADQRDREFEALLAEAARESARGEERIPEGYHRGPLAGLDPEQREQALFALLDDRVPSMLSSSREFDRRVRKRRPVRSLRGCLMLLTKVQLVSLADVLGMGGLARLKKAQMVEEIAAELPQASMALEALLSVTADGNYRLARSLASGEDVVFTTSDVAAHAFEWPIEPYVFMFRDGDTYTALVPDELKPMFAAMDFEAMDRYRRQQKQALNCVDACVVQCGVMKVEDAYNQYHSLVSDVLDREGFDRLLEIVASLGDAGFDLWTYPPSDYVVHYTLSPDYVAREFAQQQSDAAAKLYRDSRTGEFSTDPMNRFFGRMRQDLRTELESLENYKRDLVASQSHMPIKPLSRSILENDVISELIDDPNVLRLRAFLDERIPDGQEDYAFADQVVEQMVYSAIESGDLQEMFVVAMEAGLTECCEDEQRLPTLITNVYNAMPSWENNGWSPQELYERVTGRKMFFNEDGSLMKVGADDLCPCGSGKKYRDCCGR